MSSPLSRSFRFSTQHNADERRQGKLPEGITRTRTSSISLASADALSTSESNVPVASGSTPSFAHLGQSPSGKSQSLVGSSKRARGSIILANFPFGRGKKNKKNGRPQTAPHSQPFLFSEVIEISAPPKKEDEDAERERLRDAAAQSIGLDPVLLEEQAEPPDQDGDTEEAEVPPSIPRTPTPTPAVGFPNFPSTPAALAPFVQLSARFSKHYHPPSLLMFALSRQWKPRELLLTMSPESISHLHVFKSAAANERELERLEIGADSVVFVSEEEVAGKRGVVKVGGISGAEMTLHITDASEAQNWIAAIKHAVLNQRSVRAGLGVIHPANKDNIGVEPRGDLDVMLSMRAQGLLPSQSTNGTTSHEPTRGRSGSTSSARPSSPQQRAASTTVSAIRGLFSASGTRPRSPSAASTAASVHTDDGSDTQPEESFGRAGTSLLSMLRPNGSMNDRPLSPTTPSVSSSPSTPHMPVSPEPSVHPSLDRKILQDQERDVTDWAPLTRINFSNGNGAPLPIGSLPDNQLQSFGASSLQPPPRRRAWTASGPPRGPRSQPDRISHSFTSSEDSGICETLNMRQSNASAFLTQPQVTPSNSQSQEEPQRPRTASSVRSVSTNTHASAERRSSLDSGNGHGKRWSRQGILIHRLTPPSGPLPPAPSAPSQSLKSPPSFRSSMQRHPYASEESPSRPGSSQSNGPQAQGNGLSPQSISKRISTSSAQSSGTSENTHSRLASGGVSGFFSQRPRSSHRVSAPPPQRPAPSTALPPTPGEEEVPPKPPRSASPTRTTFRESLTLRTNRHSLNPPSLPPSSGLPQLPSERDPTTTKSHRRSSSSGNGNNVLFAIPASPSPLVPPFPPPNGPLPAPPAATVALPHSRQAISIKHRLRMLSAPASPPAGPVPVPPSPPSPAPSTINPYALPPTPIGEPIAAFQLQTDPSFLRGAPGPGLATPPQSPRVLVPEPSPDLSGLTSLSPPPRRGSRRMSIPIDTREKDKGEPAADADGTESAPQLQKEDGGEDRSTTPVALSPAAGLSMLTAKPSAVSLVDVGAGKEVAV